MINDALLMAFTSDLRPDFNNFIIVLKDINIPGEFIFNYFNSHPTHRAILMN